MVTKVHTSAQCATTKRRITKGEVKIQNAVIDIKEELETKQNKTNQNKKTSECLHPKAGHYVTTLRMHTVFSSLV